MKAKLDRKAVAVLVVAALVTAGVAGTVILNKNRSNAETETIEREYAAQKSTITVGVDATGQISLAGNELKLPNGVIAKEVLVEPGDEVKQGDTLATLDEEQIQKALKELQEKRRIAAGTLKAAVDNKRLSQMQAGSAIDETKYQSQKAYDDAHLAAERNIASLKSQIDTLNGQIQALENQISAAASQKSDGPSDGTSSAAESAAESQPEMQQESASTYTADSQVLQGQLDALKAQRDTLQVNLDAAKLALSDLENNRKTEIERENASVSQQQQQDAVQADSLQVAVDAAQNDLNTIDEDIAATKKLLETKSLCADRDGVVLSVLLQPGQIVGSEGGISGNANADGGSSTVLTLGMKDQQQFVVAVESLDINTVEVGQKVTFECEAFPSQKFTGKVAKRKLIPNKDGKYEVTVTVDSNDTAFQQGMAVSATLIVMQKENVLTLSNKAIQIRENGTQYVKVRGEDGQLAEVDITTGFSDGRISEVLSGISEGDTVIVEDIL